MKVERSREREACLLEVRADPNIVRFVSWAIEAVAVKGGEWGRWSEWALEWRSGQRQPGACVDVAQWCFNHDGQPAYHALGQIAWAAKEACCSTPQSAWSTLRYVADAMLALGVAFPGGSLLAIESPSASSGKNGGSEPESGPI